MADAAAHITDVVRDQAAKNKEATRNEDNEFNIRKQFLDNAVNAIRESTYSQYNIVICTDQEHDDFQNLTGQILPMDLLNLEISPGKFVNFQVYVFETGKYLRHGKWERDYWNWWGNNKQWHDPAAMHVHFEKAQPKLDANAIKAKQDEQAKKDQEAKGAAEAAKKAQDEAASKQAEELKRQADARAKEQGMGLKPTGPKGDYPLGYLAGMQPSDPYADAAGAGGGYQQGGAYGGYGGGGGGDAYGAAGGQYADTSASGGELNGFRGMWIVTDGTRKRIASASCCW